MTGTALSHIVNNPHLNFNNFRSFIKTWLICSVGNHKKETNFLEKN